MSRAIMVQGTASHVGKSVVAAGLCRLFHRRGIRVAPFKSQNMSLNAAAAAGGEIGRAQAMQAAACGLAPTVDMNPVLLKPASASQCQLILRGRPHELRSSRDHGAYSEEILDAVRASYRRLAAAHDLIVIEGAGSPAEINLLDRDIANMWTAELAGAAVILVGDIERGGVFAHLFGTWSLAPQRHRIRGFIINKFRGHRELLDSGLRDLERMTGVPVLGVLPYREIGLPEEDSLGLIRLAGQTPAPGRLRIGVVRLPYISNFTDFEPLESEPNVDLRYVTTAAEAAECEAIVLPGTKSTVADLHWLRAQGLERGFAGKPLAGICGGYQMLGVSIADPGGVESAAEETAGLGLLPVRTIFGSEKRVGEVACRVIGSGIEVRGYFIQQGRVERHGGTPLLEVTGVAMPPTDGCAAGNGSEVWGASVHGLFEGREFRHATLERWWRACRPAELVPVWSDGKSFEARIDAWAACLSHHLDLEKIEAMVNAGGGHG